MIDSSKQKALNADSKAIKEIDFTGNLEQDNGAILFFIIEEAKEIFLIFHKKPYPVFHNFIK